MPLTLSRYASKVSQSLKRFPSDFSFFLDACTVNLRRLTVLVLTISVRACSQESSYASSIESDSPV